MQHLIFDVRLRRIATTILALAAAVLILARPWNWFGYPIWRAGVEATLPEPTPVSPSLAKLVANRESGQEDGAGLPTAKATRVRIEETATMPVRRNPGDDPREERFYCVRILGGVSDGYRGWIGEDRLVKPSGR